MQTAKTKGILLLLLLLTASLLLALGLALPRHTVSAQGAVATIDGVEYDSLSAAVAAAEDGVETTITLEADTADTVTISAGKVIVLNLNGNSVSVTGSAAIQNEGTLTIKGTISGAVETDAENAIENAGTLKIEGGYFKGGISNTGSVSITGGRFSKLVPASYLAENYSIQSYNIIGKRGYSISNKAPVAEITLDGTRYVFEKISTASDAAAGGTVTLIADAEQKSFITLDTPVTLDLNGYDITYTGTVSNNLIKVTGKNVIITNSSQNESKLINQFDNGSNAYSVIYADGAKLTVENVTIESKGIGISATNSDMVVKNSTITSETGLGFGFFGGMTAEEAKTDTANYNTLTLENSSVSGHTFALAGNGTKHGTAVTIQNSTLTGTIGAGIYHPQVGTLTVGGANTKISGTSGIELRAGTLEVSGGEISATAKTFEALPNEAGSTIDGAAIAVSQHGYDPDIAVNITGGTFNGVKALYEADLQNEDVSNISVTVSGGTFKGDVGSENVTGFISGGSFQTLPNETLLGSGYAGVQYNGLYVVVKETTDAGALTVAKLAAQADIRSYSASLGFPWTDLSALSRNEKVDAILAAYNAVDAAESEGAVAVARLNALDAIDAYYTYLKGLKEAAIEDIGNYAKDGQDAEGQPVAAVAVPTYVISAINGAVSKEEIESYVKAAKAEIEEIREQRTKLAGNFETLKKNAEDLATDLTAALKGLAAIEGAVGTNENMLTALQTQLTDVETNIKAEIAAIKTLLGTAADEAGNQTLFDKIGALEAKLTTVENNIKTAVTNAVTGVSAAVEEIAAAVDALPTASVVLSGIKELIGGLQADIDAANAALEGLDGEVSGLASLVGSLDGAQYSMNKALEAFEDAVTEQLTAIQTSLTALAADADDNGAAIAVLQQKADEIAADLQSGNADLTDVAENVVSLQSALEALSADVSAQGGMTGPIIGLYVIVSVLVVLMAAVLVILLKKKN